MKEVNLTQINVLVCPFFDLLFRSIPLESDEVQQCLDAKWGKEIERVALAPEEVFVYHPTLSKPKLNEIETSLVELDRQRREEYRERLGDRLWVPERLNIEPDKYLQEFSQRNWRVRPVTTLVVFGEFYGPGGCPAIVGRKIQTGLGIDPSKYLLDKNLSREMYRLSKEQPQFNRKDEVLIS